MLADEILVIEAGRLLQAGPSADVFRRPASPAVARLLKIENLLSGTAVGGGLIEVALRPEKVERRILSTTDILPGTAVLWSVRPNQVEVSSDGLYPAHVTDLIELGTSVSVTVELDDGPELEASVADSGPLQIGSLCGVTIDPEAISVWPSPRPADAALSYG